MRRLCAGSLRSSPSPRPPPQVWQQLAAGADMETLVDTAALGFAPPGWGPQGQGVRGVKTMVKMV